MDDAPENQQSLTISQDITVQTIGSLHGELTSAFETSSEIVLEIESLGDFDLTLVQLVESARRTAAHEGKLLALATPASGELRAMLERGGFVVAAESREFWLHEGLQ